MRKAVAALGAVALLAAALVADLALNTPPAAAQTSVTVSAVDGTACGDATVAWNAITGATSYTVSWEPAGGTPVGRSGSESVAASTNTRTTLTGLTPYAQLRFTVTVVGGTNDDATGSANARAGSSCPPGPDATISAITASGFIVTWEPYEGQTGGHALRISEGTEARDTPSGDTIDRCGTADVAQDEVSCVVVSTAGVYQAILTGLSAETDYFIQIITSFAGQPHLISTGSARTTAVPTGPAPTVTVTEGTACGDLGVSWNEITGATSYVVTYNIGGVANPVSSQAVDGGSTTAYTITGLPQSLSTTVTVTVVGGDSGGAASAEVTGTAGSTGCPVPTVTVTAYCRSLNVSWTAVPEAGSYDVAVSDDLDSEDFNTSHLFATIEDLTDGVEHTITVTVTRGPSTGLSTSVATTPGTGGCTAGARAPEFDVVPPAAPALPAVTFSAVTDSSFTANWPAATGATGQAEARLYIGTTEPAVPSGATPCSSADTTSNSIICYRATTGNPTTASYSFFIDAGTLYTLDVWKTVSGTWTKIATGTVTTTGTFTPVSPTIRVTTGGACGQVEVTWDAVVDAEGWTVTWTAPGGISGTSGRLGQIQGLHLITEASLTSGQTVSVTVTQHGGRSDGQSSTATAAASTTGCAAPDPAPAPDPDPAPAPDPDPAPAPDPDPADDPADDPMDDDPPPMDDDPADDDPMDDDPADDPMDEDDPGDGRPEGALPLPPIGLPPVQTQLAQPSPGLDPVDGEGPVGDAGPSEPVPEFAPDPSTPDAPAPRVHVQVRDNLVAAQETLLNIYRCRYSVDVSVVPGGCVDGRPASGDTRPGEAAPDPTHGDVIMRDELVAAQEALLNIYRCRFNVDVSVVPGGCVNGRPAPNPA